MEKEGLVRSTRFLEENDIHIDTLITDRHPQIRKWMREMMPGVEHLFDVWHIAKGTFSIMDGHHGWSHTTDIHDDVHYVLII